MIIPLSWIHADFEFFTCMFDFAMIMAPVKLSLLYFVVKEIKEKDYSYSCYNAGGVFVVFVFVYITVYCYGVLFGVLCH